MRSIAFFSLFLLACAGHGEPPARVPTQARGPADSDAARRPKGSDFVGRTHIDGADLTLDLPGQWEEHPVEGGHELRGGDREQIIVSLFPPTQGLDSASSAAHMAEAQQHGMASQCKRATDASIPTVASTPPRAVRFHVVCEEPRVVATFVAAPLGGNVLSYEHYWYRAPAFSPELERADDAILATLHPKATVPACPSAVLAEAVANGGTCLEAAILGKAVVEECRRSLESRGWTQDEAAANVIGRQTAKKLVCYRKPL